MRKTKEGKSSSEPTARAAEAFWRVQRQIDQTTVPGVTVGHAGQPAFAAQYAATEDPPLARLGHYYGKARAHATAMGVGGLPAEPQVILPFGREDVAAMEAKEKMALQLEFDKWIMRNYNPWSNPVWTEWLQKKYPSFFEARLAEMKSIHELQKQWQQIQIMGVQNIEDLYLVWRVKSDPALQRRLRTAAPGPDHTVLAAGTDAARQRISGYVPGRWGMRVRGGEDGAPAYPEGADAAARLGAVRRLIDPSGHAGFFALAAAPQQAPQPGGGAGVQPPVVQGNV